MNVMPKKCRMSIVYQVQGENLDLSQEGPNAKGENHTQLRVHVFAN